MINSGAQNCTFTERHISSDRATSERISQKFGCENESHQCVKEEFVSGFGITSAYSDIMETGQSIPLETNAKKTYTNVSCTHLMCDKKVLNSPSIQYCMGIENNTLQEQQEEKLVDTTPMEGLTYLRTKLMEKKKRRRR